jgi:dipeptidyl-peptidase-4
MLKKTIVLLILITSFLDAKTQKKLTIQDAVVGSYTKFRVKSYRNLTWVDNSNISYIEKNSIIGVDVEDEEETVIYSLDQLNEVLNDNNLNEVKTFPNFSWVSDEVISFKSKNNYLRVNIDDNEIESKITINDSARFIERAPNQTNFAYKKGKNIFVLINGEEIKVTDVNDPNITVGEVVSRNEFGIHKGMFWSPDSKKLAFYVKDESNVSDYPIIDYTKSPVKLKNIKYPRVGEESEILKVGIYNSKTKDTVYLHDTDKGINKYFTNITWSPDSKKIYVQVLSRNQKVMLMNEYDGLTGDFNKTIFTEINDKYVEPENTITFLNQDKDKFVYQSENDGYNHLYLFNTAGEQLKQITKGDWIVTQLLAISEDDKFIYYISTEGSPLDRHLYKINIETLERTKLTRVLGTHNVKLSKDFKYFIDEYSNVNTPKATVVVNAENGSHVMMLDKAKNPFSAYDFPKMNIGTIKTKDKNTELKCRIILPPNFDPTKKYPAIVYVYGGPHAQLIRNQWLGGARLWQYYMAQKGYVMFTLDNRGSANRGFEFESAVHKKLGQLEMEDQLQGVKYLKSLKYVDNDRIGVFGWSFGGFMTTSLLLNHPDVFKVGVAGGPVTDWRFYEIMYGERYMETPETNPEGFAKSSTLDKAKNLKAKFMLIHGTLDPVVVQEHSMKLLREFVKENKPVDYMLYPAHEHNVRGKDRVHLMDKISEYFVDYL